MAIIQEKAYINNKTGEKFFSSIVNTHNNTVKEPLHNQYLTIGIDAIKISSLLIALIKPTHTVLSKNVGDFWDI
jgi:hypothetical protein